MHNRGLGWSERFDDISSYVMSAYEDPSFAAPSTVKAIPQQQIHATMVSSLVRPMQSTASISGPLNNPGTEHEPTTTKAEMSGKTPAPIPKRITPVNIQEKCFPRNSNRWIQGNKDSNHDAGMSPELIDTLLEGPRQFVKLPDLFQQTICHEKSPFKAVAEQTPPVPLEQRAEEWYQRFFYLALHWGFHRPALPEYQARKECQDDDNLRWRLEDFQQKHGIKNLDFECPNAKFVISPIGHIGFGAFINTQVCMTILIALRTGRIPIFTSQSLYPWQKGDTDPWLLAPTHCDKDLQCYYMPMTPCVLLLDDIRNSTRYGSTTKEQRWLRVNVDIPAAMTNDRVVAINSGLQSKGHETVEIRNITSIIVQELMDEWILQQRDDDTSGNFWSKEDWKAMDVAKQWMVDKFQDDAYGLMRQMYVYFLRLNPQYKAVLENRSSALVPQDYKPSNSVGVAIRGSDKCQKESTCLPFSRYMELMTDVVYPSFENPSTRPRLILTTEDPSIFNKSLPFQQNASFPFEFLVNDEDNMQGSGFPKDFRDQGENTIVSTMTALQLHLTPSQVYLNCCSNFHAVIRNLISAQCGAVRHGNAYIYSHLPNSTSAALDAHTPEVARCLSEEGVVPKKYRICCGWYKRDTTCDEIWEEHLQNREDIMEKMKTKRIG